MNLSIQCECGSFRGIAHDVTPDAGNHVICYCDDCQAFQHFLGRTEDVLDAHGGTRIFQMSPGKFEITAGREHLACMRLTPEGIVRWFTSCCKSPLGNTLATPTLLFVGVIVACFEAENDEARLDAALGPVLCGVHGRFALGKPSNVDVHATAPVGLILRFMTRMLRWKLRGDGKRSPFFDPETKTLAVRPLILKGADSGPAS